MEEKVLIKSELSERAKKVFLGIIIAFLAVGILFTSIHALCAYNARYQSAMEGCYIDEINDSNYGKYEYQYSYRDFYRDKYGELRWTWNSKYYYYDTFEELLKSHPKAFDDSFWDIFWHSGSAYIYVLFGSLLISLLFFIVYKGYLKSTLTITEKNVIGRTLFGKKVTLPIYQITAYSIRSLFSKIIVSSPSGSTAFTLIENYEDIGNVLAKLINKRQEDTIAKSDVGTKNNSNNLEDLKKLKELLDNGIISQEEFETKKKQLLGI